MNGKKVLITGGTGYIGSEIVKNLIKKNIEIALIVRDTKNASKIFDDTVEYISSANKDIFKTLVKNFSPNIVLHLAAYSTSSDNAEEVKKLIDSNIIFTSNLLLALENCKIDLFVNTGSFSEYYYNTEQISPTYFYSATKTSARYMIEYFARKNDFKFVNAILYTVYGKKNKHKKIIDYAIESLKVKKPIKMSNGKQILDFIHIDDVVNFYANLVSNYDKFTFSKIDYHVGSGKGISIRELVTMLESITKKQANIEWGANKSRKIDSIKACAITNDTSIDLAWKSNIELLYGLKNYIEVEI